MLKNYLIIAFRNLLKQRAFWVVNIIGLSMGLTVVLLLCSYIMKEQNINSQIKDADRLYHLQSVWKDDKMGVTIATTAPLAQKLKEDYPHLVANYYRFHAATSVVTANDKQFKEELQIGDTTLIDMFNFVLLAGSTQDIQHNPDGMVITDEAALKYFGKTDVLGETMEVATSSGGKSKVYTIAGIINMPDENAVTHLMGEQYHFFLPASDMARFNSNITGWNSIYIVSFVELQPDVLPEQLAPPVQMILQTHAPEQISDNLSIKLIPLSDFYFEYNPGARKLVYALRYIVLFILLLVLANFIASLIGATSRRLKESVMRTVLGGSFSSLTMQYFVEVFLISGISLFLAISFYQMALPYFTLLVEKQPFHLAEFSLPAWMLLCTFVLSLSLMLGYLQAYLLSRPSPAQTLKNNISTKARLYRKGLAPRKILTAVQLSIALFLCISTLVVSEQVQYFFQKDLGYDQENLMILTLPRDWSPQGIQAVLTARDQIQQIPGVSHACVSYEIPNGNFGTSAQFKGHGKEGVITVSMPLISIDENYFETYNARLLTGRNLAYEKDDKKVMVNASAVKAFGWSDPIGQQLWVSTEQKAEVVGVVEDFHIAKMDQPIEPVVFQHLSFGYRYMTLRLESHHLSHTIDQVKAAWSELFPGALFSFRFMNDYLADIYQSEIKLRKAARLASALSILILFLGIFNATLLSTAARTKEIGIRKVLGASLSSIYYLFVKDYFLVILISFLASVPLVYAIMQFWLENFAYKAALSPMVFALPCLVILLLVMITVMIQSSKTALTNPSESLRYE